jgi:hypothetical protein
MNSFDYLKTSPLRNMPWIKRGMQCDMDGKKGVVTAGDGEYVRVRLDGEKTSGRYHPHWQATYYDEHGNIVKDYKEQQQPTSHTGT